MRAMKTLVLCWMLLITMSLVHASEELIWTPMNIPGSGAFSGIRLNSGLWFHGDFGWLNTGEQLWVTHDAGRSWLLSLTPPENRYFYDSYFINSTEGWVVAAHDEPLFHTKDGGVSWEESKVELAQTSKEPADPALIVLTRVYFKNSLYGLGVFGIVDEAIPGPGWKNSIIARTEDGGQHWKELIRCFPFPRVMGFDDYIWIDNQMGPDYYTMDLGNTMQSVNIPGDILVFASPSYGWIVKVAYVSDVTRRWQLLKTTDGGNTWSDPILSITGHYLSNISGYCLMSADLGMILWHSNREEEGPSLLHVTFNGGKSWVAYRVPIQSECIVSCNTKRREVWLLPYILSEKTAIFRASVDTVTALQTSNKLFTTWALLKKVRKEH